MKTSYTKTPRSLKQAQFITDADPFDYAPRGLDPKDRIVVRWSLVLLVVGLIVIGVTG
jgi:hypothetical protein